MIKKSILVVGLLLLATLACTAQACTEIKPAYTPYCTSVNAFPLKYSVVNNEGTEAGQKNGDDNARIRWDVAKQAHPTASEECAMAFGHLQCAAQLPRCYYNSKNKREESMRPCRSLCRAAQKACPSGFANIEDNFCAAPGELCYPSAAPAMFTRNAVLTVISIVFVALFSM